MAGGVLALELIPTLLCHEVVCRCPEIVKYLHGVLNDLNRMIARICHNYPSVRQGAENRALLFAGAVSAYYCVWVCYDDGGHVNASCMVKRLEAIIATLRKCNCFVYRYISFETD